MKNHEIYDLIVIGGGASGMMAAAVASGRGKKVLILEKNKELGKKLKISGGGRCNITNDEGNTREFLKHYGESSKFLHSSFSQFNKKDTFEFFESRGLPLVVEARKRAFPSTQKAFDVFKTLERELVKNKVEIKLGTAVEKVIVSDHQITSVKTDKGSYKATSYLISTGGNSHPETGSTGDGFKWLTDLGHTVLKSNPNLVPIRVKESWVHALSGTTLTFMKITFFVDGKKSFQKLGKILFTHFGLSGPLILNSSFQINRLLSEGEVTATIDCYPDTPIEDIEKRVLKVFDTNKNKSLKNCISEFLPEGIPGIFFQVLSQIDPDKKVHSITVDERREIVKFIKGMPITITGLMGMDRAVVSDGGVPLSEVDMRTCRSMKISNLYLTGDILNINRPSGGYSLQLCWTTGYIVGRNC